MTVGVRRYGRWACLLSVLVFAEVGCGGGGGPSGPKLAPAKGVVNYNSKPLSSATVMFIPPKGNPGMDMSDEQGKFVITTGGRPGVAVGKCKVVVTKTATAAEGFNPNMTPKDMEDMIKAGKSFDPPKNPIPTRYGSETTTTLEADVTENAESNAFEFNLVD